MSVGTHQSIPTCFVVLFCVAVAGSYSVHALAGQLQGTHALPGEPCQIKARGGWSSQERWVWKQVCDGKSANFNRSKGYGGYLDPKKLEGWSEKRVLSPQFLETILNRSS